MKLLPSTVHKWLGVPLSLHLRTVHRVKKPRATVLFIHGLGNTGASWDKVIAKLPKDIQVYSVDLLGFGESPRPSWAKYDAKTQARSLAITLLKLRNTRKLTVVGHSLGSLVSIELAKRYPKLVSGLLLCSPPLYDTATTRKFLPTGDKMLRDVYEQAMARPDQFLALASFAMKYRLANETFNVTADNFDSYRRTLKTAIINQTSLQDALSLRLPVRIIIGKLDPFVVSSNIRLLARQNQNVHVTSIVAGHEVVGKYGDTVVRQLELLLKR